MLRKLAPFAFAVATLCLTSGAQADGIDRSIFSFGGFGTLSFTRSTEKNADFSSSVYVPNGVGYTRNWSANIDTRLGGQVTANFTPKLSSVVQIMVEQQWDNSYTPTFEWLNVKYAFTPNASVRLGRIVMPSFLISDSRKVGYASTWIRTPGDVYNILPLTSSDGIDASYRFPIGNAINTVTALYGRDTDKAPDGTPEGMTIELDKLWGFVDNLEYGAATFHMAYHAANVNVPKIADVPVPGFRDLVVDAPFRFLTFGASYDPGSWFVMGEWVKSTLAILGNRKAWYLHGGYRIGQWTPYLTYSQRKQVTISGFGTSTAARTTSAGVRWDFAKNTALKLQADQIKMPSDSYGQFMNMQPGFPSKDKANVFSMTIDFMF